MNDQNRYAVLDEGRRKRWLLYIIHENLVRGTNDTNVLYNTSQISQQSTRTIAHVVFR